MTVGYRKWPLTHSGPGPGERGAQRSNTMERLSKVATLGTLSDVVFSEAMETLVAAFEERCRDARPGVTINPEKGG